MIFSFFTFTLTCPLLRGVWTHEMKMMKTKDETKLCGWDEAAVGQGVVSLTNLAPIPGGEGKPFQTQGDAKAKGLKTKYFFKFRGWRNTPLDP